MTFRRICGVLALVMFSGFQLEAMMPDQCDDTTGTSISMPEGTPSAPGSDGHLLHSCHCLHLHLAMKSPPFTMTVPSVEEFNQGSLALRTPAAPPHLPFRPPLV